MNEPAKPLKLISRQLLQEMVERVCSAEAELREDNERLRAANAVRFGALERLLGAIERMAPDLAAALDYPCEALGLESAAHPCTRFFLAAQDVVDAAKVARARTQVLDAGRALLDRLERFDASRRRWLKRWCDAERELAAKQRALDAADEFEGRLIDACRSLHKRWLEERRLTRIMRQEKYARMSELLALRAERDRLNTQLAEVSATACGEREASRKRIADLEAALDRDKTGLAAALGRVREEVRARSWLLHGRGPYEWDDDRYKDEAGLAMRSVLDIAERALRESGVVADAALRKEVPRG